MKANIVISTILPFLFLTFFSCARNSYIDLSSYSNFVPKNLNSTITAGYPSGVFNINGVLIGNANNESELAALWNADPENSTLGTLSPDGTGSFKFKAKNGQTAPEKILAMRYFQFDLAWDLIDTMSFPQDSIVDFGDGTIQKFDGTTPFHASIHSYATFNGNIATYLSNSANNVPGSSFTLNNPVYAIYKTYIDKSPKTITVYHSDNDYYLYTDNNFNLPQNGSSLMSNLRGHMPRFFKGAQFTGTQQSSFNTFQNVNYNEFKNNFQYIEMRFGGATAFTNYNFGFLDFPNLIAIGFGTFLSSYPGLIKDIIGTTEIHTKYPLLKSVAIKHSQYSSDLNLSIPNIQQFLLFNYGEASVLTAADCDNILITLDSVKSDTGGRIYIQGCTRTSASDTATANLRAKGVDVVGQP